MMMEGVCIDKKDCLSNSIIELFYDNCFIQAQSDAYSHIDATNIYLMKHFNVE